MEQEKTLSLNSLIVVEQIPIIKQRLREFKEELDSRVEYVCGLTVTDDNIKEMKKELADIRKIKVELETRRKDVKKQVLQPYEEFERFYKEFATAPLDTAIQSLDKQIKANESQKLADKTDKLKAYLEECKQAHGIEFVQWEQLGIRVNLSTSEKKYKTQISEFVEGISNDLLVIARHPMQDEIFVIYKQTLNLAQAITSAEERQKAVEAEKARREQEAEARAKLQGQIDQTAQIIEAVTTPPIIEVVEEVPQEDAEIYQLTFSVYGTQAQLRRAVPEIKKLLSTLKERKDIDNYE